jgi:hypothetical protein
MMTCLVMPGINCSSRSMPSGLEGAPTGFIGLAALLFGGRLFLFYQFSNIAHEKETQLSVDPSPPASNGDPGQNFIRLSPDQHPVALPRGVDRDRGAVFG